MKIETKDELNYGEAHPAARDALRWLKSLEVPKLMEYQESFASTALSGNRLAEVCAGTLGRLLNSEPVSDRYLLGLCWTIKHLESKND